MGFVMFVVDALYLLLPALLANMTPPLMKGVEFLNYPVDFGKRWRGRPLFGSHKTYRGLFFGIVVAIVICLIQRWLYIDFTVFETISLIDYSQQNFIVLGFLMGFGALAGDMVESLIKRQVGVKPGSPWVPWDQVDFVIGALLFLMIVYVPPWQTSVFLIICVPFLHILTNHIGYWIGVNKSKW